MAARGSRQRRWPQGAVAVTLLLFLLVHYFLFFVDPVVVDFAQFQRLDGHDFKVGAALRAGCGAAS